MTTTPYAEVLLTDGTIAAGRDLGISRFRAEMLSDNAAMARDRGHDQCEDMSSEGRALCRGEA